MPMPDPDKDEKHDGWIERCMANPTMNSEYPDSKQRYAVCQGIWEKKESRGETIVKIERRFIPIEEEADLRIESLNEKPHIVGYAVKWGRRSKPIAGLFQEVFERGAFLGVLQARDTSAIRDHNPTMVLGRMAAGTLALYEDETGLRYDIDPPNTSYAHDLLESIRRRDVAGASVGFWATKDGVGWTEAKNKDEYPVRTVRRVAGMPEISITAFPAYPDSEASLRSTAEEVFNARTASQQQEPSEADKQAAAEQERKRQADEREREHERLRVLVKV